jgi:hypothetical protein
MNFDEFSRVAQRAFESVPAAYREGVDGLTTVEAVETHPEHPDVVTMGECLTQAFGSEWQGPDTTRSQVVLYYGSFQRMAEDDPDFDWAGEIWETLTHELQHHLESLADEDALEAVDYALDQSFKREQGELFDPWYFQSGEPMAEGVYRVEDEVYIEQALTSEQFDRMEEIEFTWKGRSYCLPRPAELGDVHFIVVDGIESEVDGVEPRVDGVEPEADSIGPYLQIVLIKRASWRQRLWGALRRESSTVLESRAEARRVGRS